MEDHINEEEWKNLVRREIVRLTKRDREELRLIDVANAVLEEQWHEN